jgi:uncharacterized protein (DUF362 family)
MEMKKHNNGKKSKDRRISITRRAFLSLSGMATAGLIITGCRSARKRLPGTSNDKKSKVALAKAESYDRQILRREIRNMFDDLGGLGDIIKPGSRVAIKVNLTGGLRFSGEYAKVGINAHWTHPEVVRAVGEALIDAGAKELFIMDGIYEDNNYEFAGYTEIADALGARLINLNNPDPYDDFLHQKTGEGWYVYEEFIFNRLVSDVDAFVTIPKLKCHNNCGVTLSMKNHIGLGPVRYYCSEAGRDNRSGMHGTRQEAPTRLPKVIIDLLRARPIDLSIIDGIKTVEGGEGPWIRNTFNMVEPGILVAGKNPVATDAVATAAMGFNPDAAAYETPFVNSLNHLALACEKGLGTNHLEEIEIVGETLEDVVYPFKPCVKSDNIASVDKRDNNCLNYKFPYG